MGRKRKDPQGRKAVRRTVTLTPDADEFLATMGNASEAVENMIAMRQIRQLELARDRLNQIQEARRREKYEVRALKAKIAELAMKDREARKIEDLEKELRGYVRKRVTRLRPVDLMKLTRVNFPNAFDTTKAGKLGLGRMIEMVEEELKRPLP